MVFLSISLALVICGDAAFKMALNEAISRKHPRLIRAILSLGVDVNAPQWYFFSTAINGGDCEIIKTLIESGVNTNSLSRNGETALDLLFLGTLSGSNLEERVRLLVENGASVVSTGTIGCGCLHLAMNYRVSLNTVKYLIEKGADVNQKDRKGNSPAHIASKKGLKSFLHTLYNSGCEINSKNNDGQTPLDVALVAKEENPFPHEEIPWFIEKPDYIGTINYLTRVGGKIGQEVH